MSTGKFREVGMPRPLDGVYVFRTAKDRAEYLKRLARFQVRNALLCQVGRVLEPGEPRVKHFRTLEEADADLAAAKGRLARWLEQRRRKVVS